MPFGGACLLAPLFRPSLLPGGGAPTLPSDPSLRPSRNVLRWMFGGGGGGGGGGGVRYRIIYDKCDDLRCDAVRGGKRRG